jgi:hypothetical protein
MTCFLLPGWVEDEDLHINNAAVVGWTPDDKLPVMDAKKYLRILPAWNGQLSQTLAHDVINISTCLSKLFGNAWLMRQGELQLWRAYQRCSAVADGVHNNQSWQQPAWFCNFSLDDLKLPYGSVCAYGPTSTQRQQLLGRTSRTNVDLGKDKCSPLFSIRYAAAGALNC